MALQYISYSRFSIATAIRENSKLLRDGGIADHCIIIAYHWLIQARFTEQERTWLEVDAARIQETASEVALDALKPYNKEELIAFLRRERTEYTE